MTDELAELCKGLSDMRFALEYEGKPSALVADARAAIVGLHARLKETERRHAITELDACAQAERFGIERKRAESAERERDALREKLEKAKALSAAAAEWQSARSDLCTHYEEQRRDKTAIPAGEKWTRMGNAEDALRKATLAELEQP